MKNTHIEHPEDTILTGDLSVLDTFVTKSKLSVKIDGAPAIVWGTDPSNNQFFVGTKSVFNKFKIKINSKKKFHFKIKFKIKFNFKFRFKPKLKIKSKFKFKIKFTI